MMKTIMRRLETSAFETKGLHQARNAVIDYTRGRITKDEAATAMREGGWPDAHIEKLLASARRHIKFTSH